MLPISSTQRRATLQLPNAPVIHLGAGRRRGDDATQFGDRRRADGGRGWLAGPRPTWISQTGFVQL